MSTPGGLQRQFYDMLMESQWWPADDLRDYQRGQLGQLLRHAKRNVPFYETRLDAVLKPNGDIDWDRWGEIPTLRRTDLVAYREAMQARDMPAGHGPTHVLASSGSTGVAIQVTTTAVAQIADRALRWRVQRWHDLDWSKVMLNRMGSAANSDWFGGAEAMGTWGALGDPATERGAMWTIDKNLPIERVFDILRDRHCSYLTAGPLLSHIGARDALRLGVDLRIEAILTQGNVVKPEDRAICRRVFGARMIEHYSTTEGGQLAHECPLGRLHLNVEGSLVEVLNDEGEPCGPGETGRVAITPIFQTAQPLIRYEIGDLATVGAPCACGRHSPTLLAVIGRTISVFHHPDGRAKTILLPPDTHDVLGSLYYQVAQTGPTTFEVRYVPADWEQAGDEQAVGVTLREMTFEDSQVRFVRLRDMPSGRSGKLIEYINEWSPAN